MSDYAEILQTSWDDIPEPQNLPTGSWKLKLRNVNFIPAKEDKSAKVLFFYTAKAPDFANTDLVAQFFIERDKDWDQVRKHLKVLGVEPEGSIQDTFKKAKGSEVFAYVGERTYKNSQGTLVTTNTLSDFEAIEG
jgi:hypothetical protein